MCTEIEAEVAEIEDGALFTLTEVELEMTGTINLTVTSNRFMVSSLPAVTGDEFNKE